MLTLLLVLTTLWLRTSSPRPIEQPIELLRLGSDLQGPFREWVGSYPVLGTATLPAARREQVLRELRSSLILIHDPKGCLCDFFPEWAILGDDGDELWISFWRREAVLYDRKGNSVARYWLRKSATDELYRELFDENCSILPTGVNPGE